MIIKRSDAKIDSVYTDKESAEEDIKEKVDVKEPKEKEKSDERD